MCKTSEDMASSEDKKNKKYYSSVKKKSTISIENRLK